MSLDPELPRIPGSASSGVPGPPMLRQPSYSGEQSTLASPGPSVELTAVPGRGAADVELQKVTPRPDDVDISDGVAASSVAGGVAKDVSAAPPAASAAAPVLVVAPPAVAGDLGNDGQGGPPVADGFSANVGSAPAAAGGLATDVAAASPGAGGLPTGGAGPPDVEGAKGCASAAPFSSPPQERMAASLSVAATVPESDRRESISCGTIGAVPPGEGPGEEGTAAPKDGVGNEPTTERLPLGLNRYVLATLFAVIVLLKGCTYWGWNGFQDMFYKSGAYAWECRPGVPGYGQSMRVGGIDYEDCAARKNSINNMYTVIFCTHFISSAFSGWVLDAAGPKICMLAAILVEVAGWLFFAFSSKTFCAYYAGATLLGIAADPAYLPLLSVSALFPGNESFIMSIMGSCRSISFAVPVILARIYVSATVPTSSLWVVIVCYVGVGLGFCFIVTFLLVPLKPFQPLSEEAKERRKALRAAEKAAKKQRKTGSGGAGDTSDLRGNSTGRGGAFTAGKCTAAENALLQGQEVLLTPDKDSATSVAGRVAEEASPSSSSTSPQGTQESYPTFWSCLKSKEFLLILPCFLIALLRTEFYSKSNKEQLIVSTTGKDLYQMFSVVNILSFIPGPVMGKLADRYGIVFVLTLLNTCGIFVYVFLMPDEIVCKAISILFYFFYCSFVLSNLYCYVAVNFPQRYFGKLTGFASLVGGVFSLTSLGWYKLSSETLISWSPRNYLLVDSIMVLLGLVNCFIIYGMYDAQRKKKKAILGEEQQGTRDPAAMC